MTLDDLLNRTIDLLQHPEFKNFGSLQKHRYQMSKRNDDDIELLRDLYKGTLIPKDQKDRATLGAKRRRAQDEKSNKLSKYIKKLTQIKKRNSYNKFLNKMRYEKEDSI